MYSVIKLSSKMKKTAQKAKKAKKTKVIKHAELWETPQEELEACEEYQALKIIEAELGIIF